jgi:hypothetical protein
MVKKQKYVKKLRFEEQEDILKEWFENASSSNLPLRGIILREKAMHIAKRLQIETMQNIRLFWKTVKTHNL